VDAYHGVEVDPLINRWKAGIGTRVVNRGNGTRARARVRANLKQILGTGTVGRSDRSPKLPSHWSCKNDGQA